MSEFYQNPLISRYASAEMAGVFSDDKKFKTWRKLWIALAESEMELGLSISKEQIEELKASAEDINYDVANAREKEVKHDVMAHVYAYGVQCPKAKGIIHLGATSCFVGDNTDIIVYDEALDIVLEKLVNVMKNLSDFALEYKAVPTLGFTHFQPAQVTTVGKRAALWLQDLTMDYQELIEVKYTVRLRGLKGTTGTQASYLELFNGDHEKVKTLENKICEKMGYRSAFSVTGQTYPRKLDSRI
ncbi:MAG: lyase family protein, partial [Eubacteriales bacterium]